MSILETYERDFIGERVLAVVIKLGISRGVHPGLSGWALNPIASVPIRDTRE